MPDGAGAGAQLELQPEWGLSHDLGWEKPKRSKDVTFITLNTYKQNPQDLFGSLNDKATLYELSSMSCDFQGLGPKELLKKLLQLDVHAAARGGPYILGISSTLHHAMERAEQWQWQQQGQLHSY